MSLSPKELQSFHENGFIGPFQIYAPDTAKQLLRSIRRNNFDKSKAIYQNDVNYDRHFDIPELAQHICHPEIISKLNSIFGPDILCWRTEFFPKFPGSKGTEWHQVASYQYANGIPMLQPTLKVADNDFMDLTVWTTFTEATIENGCMKFLPGSHKHRYYDESKPITTGRDTNYQSDATDTSFYGYHFSEFKIDPNWSPDENEAVSIEMQPGECIIFTARCVHASHPNTTERSTRFAISSRYVPSHVKVYPDQDGFLAHGSEFSLENYGCVLVSGQDSYHHNKLRSIDNHGHDFIRLID